MLLFYRKRNKSRKGKYLCQKLVNFIDQLQSIILSISKYIM